MAPFDIEKQICTVRSWLKSGFQIVSCNTKQEIEILKKYFSEGDVEFVEIKRDASAIINKPLPYLDDIIEEVSKRTDRICGYINADIYLDRISPELYKYITKQAEGSFLFAHRYEISDLSDIDKLKCKMHFDGIDLFFIDKCLAKEFFDNIFFVQSPWDLCVLLKCELLNIPIKELCNPIAFHLRHIIRWDLRRFDKVIDAFWEKHFSTSECAFRKILNDYYRILLYNCQQVCYCKKQNYRCLFVADKRDINLIQSIKGQQYVEIDIQNDDSNGNSYDFVFYAEKGVIYRNIFCKAIISVMEEFGYSTLNIGRFFVSGLKDRWKFSEINRNIELLEQLNFEEELETVTRKVGSYAKTGKWLYPVSYERIDLTKDDVQDIIDLEGDIFIMPAGNRANEWFFLNKDRLKEINLLGYLDNDEKKIGEYIWGIPVYPISQLDKERGKIIHVIVASKYYSDEIISQLSNVLDPEKILNANLMIHIEENGRIYYFNRKKYRKWMR